MNVDFSKTQRHREIYNKTSKSLLSKGNIDISLSSGVSDKMKESFYREFALLLSSGVDFNKALEIIIKQEKKKKFKTILERISFDVTKGKTLFEAFKSNHCFTDYEVFSIKAGEEIKKLPEILTELKVYFSRKIKLKRQVISILAYPSFVLIITLAVLYFMLNYVVPMFSTIFKQFGGELPKITQYVIWISSKFNGLVLGLVVILVLFIALNKFFGKRAKIRYVKAQVLLKIPIFGALIKKVDLAKFCQIMGLLLTSKTSLNESLELSSKVVELYPLQMLISDSQIKITKGISLYDSFDTGFFDDKFLTIIRLGEEVNQLDTMFNELTSQLNEEIEHKTKLIGAILEPLMIVVIAVIVGFILIAMYYPMFNLSQVLQN